MQITPLQNSYNLFLAAAYRTDLSAAQNTAPLRGGSTENPGIILDISQEAKDYAAKLEEIQKTGGCQTCKNRRYVDESSDSTVSYQSPTKIGPGEAAGKVMAHEQEHVTNETARAEQNDRRVVSSSVSLQTSICPECGKPYVSGGTTRVVTASASQGDDNKPDAEITNSSDKTQDNQDTNI